MLKMIEAESDLLLKGDIYPFKNEVFHGREAQIDL